MAVIMDGKALAKRIRQNLKEDVDRLRQCDIIPKLAVIMVGENEASKIYVRNKSIACQEIGIEFEEFMLDSNISMQELKSVICDLNERKDIHGILLQSPIPQQLDINEAFRTISEKKDVDGFNPINVGKLSLGQDTFVACTPFGVLKLLEEYKITIQGKHVVILGRSNIVGKPLIQCMLQKNATVTVCHSKTENIAQFTKQADILIVAIGKKKFVTADMVKDGATVIDIGINRDEKGKICGDVDFESVEKKVAYITPVPGGVGPMTIAMLMNNVVKACSDLLRDK